MVCFSGGGRTERRGYHQSHSYCYTATDTQLPTATAGACGDNSRTFSELQ